jgi:hypothetical protein
MLQNIETQKDEKHTFSIGNEVLGMSKRGFSLCDLTL